MVGDSSFGLVLQYAPVGDAGNFANVSHVISIQAPKPKKNTYSKKTLTQANRWEPFAGAFVDAGEMTLTVAFDKTQHAALLGLVPETDPNNWRLVVPDAPAFGNRSCMNFAGLLTEGPGLDLPEDGGRMQCDLTLKVSGEISFTAGS